MFDSEAGCRAATTQEAFLLSPSPPNEKAVIELVNTYADSFQSSIRCHFDTPNLFQYSDPWKHYQELAKGLESLLKSHWWTVDRLYIIFAALWVDEHHFGRIYPSTNYTYCIQGTSKALVKFLESSLYTL